MPDLDPHDSGAVAEVVRRRAADRWGVAVTLAEPPSSIGAGFDSYIHTVHLTDRDSRTSGSNPSSSRLLPSVDREAQAHQEADVAAVGGIGGLPARPGARGHRLDRGLRTARPRSWSGPRVARCSTRSPRSRRERFRLIDQLARLQLDLHALPVDAWPGAREPQALVDKRLGLPRRVADAAGRPGRLADALRRAEELHDGGHGGPAGGEPRRLPPAERRRRRRWRRGHRLDRRRARPAARPTSPARCCCSASRRSATSRPRARRPAPAGPHLARRYRRIVRARRPPRSGPAAGVGRAPRPPRLVPGPMLHAGGFDGESSADEAGSAVGPARLDPWLEGPVRGCGAELGPTVTPRGDHVGHGPLAPTHRPAPPPRVVAPARAGQPAAPGPTAAPGPSTSTRWC